MPATSNTYKNYFARKILFPRDTQSTKQILICMKLGLTGKINLHMLIQTPVFKNFGLAD